MYPLCTAASAVAAGMLRYPYPFGGLSTAPGGLPPFSLMSPHTGGMHPGMLPHSGLPLPGQLPNGQGGPKSEKK